MIACLREKCDAVNVNKFKELSEDYTTINAMATLICKCGSD
jgi:hypothetical protein